MTLRELLSEAIKFNSLDDEVNIRVLTLNERGCADTVKLVPIIRITCLSHKTIGITILEHDIVQATSIRA